MLTDISELKTKYRTYIIRRHGKRVELLASEICGNAAQNKTSGTHHGTYGRNTTTSFMSRAPKKNNSHEYHPGTHKDLHNLSIHPQPQHQNPCLLSRHSIRNPLPLWTFFPMSTLRQRHVPSHWTIIIQIGLISCPNTFGQDLILFTDIDSLIATLQRIKSKKHEDHYGSITYILTFI